MKNLQRLFFLIVLNKIVQCDVKNSRIWSNSDQAGNIWSNSENIGLKGNIWSNSDKRENNRNIWRSSGISGQNGNPWSNSGKNEPIEDIWSSSENSGEIGQPWSNSEKSEINLGNNKIKENPWSNSGNNEKGRYIWSSSDNSGSPGIIWSNLRKSEKSLENNEFDGNSWSNSGNNEKSRDILRNSGYSGKPRIILRNLENLWSNSRNNEQSRDIWSSSENNGPSENTWNNFGNSQNNVNLWGSSGNSEQIDYPSSSSEQISQDTNLWKVGNIGQNNDWSKSANKKPKINGPSNYANVYNDKNVRHGYRVQNGNADVWYSSNLDSQKPWNNNYNVTNIGKQNLNDWNQIKFSWNKQEDSEPQTYYPKSSQNFETAKRVWNKEYPVIDLTNAKQNEHKKPVMMLNPPQKSVPLKEPIVPQRNLFKSPEIPNKYDVQQHFQYPEISVLSNNAPETQVQQNPVPDYQIPNLNQQYEAKVPSENAWQYLSTISQPPINIQPFIPQNSVNMQQTEHVFPLYNDYIPQNVPVLNNPSLLNIPEFGSQYSVQPTMAQEEQLLPENYYEPQTQQNENTWMHLNTEQHVPNSINNNLANNREKRSYEVYENGADADQNSIKRMWFNGLGYSVGRKAERNLIGANENKTVKIETVTETVTSTTEKQNLSDGQSKKNVADETTKNNIDKDIR